MVNASLRRRGIPRGHMALEHRWATWMAGRNEAFEGLPLIVSKVLLSSKIAKGFDNYRKQSAALLEARPRRGRNERGGGGGVVKKHGFEAQLLAQELKGATE